MVSALDAGSSGSGLSLAGAIDTQRSNGGRVCSSRQNFHLKKNFRFQAQS